jgi:hypothetical protein
MATATPTYRMEFLPCPDPYENPANRPFMEQFIQLKFMYHLISIDYHEKLNEYVVDIDTGVKGRFFKCLGDVTLGGLIDYFFGTYAEELAVRDVYAHRGDPAQKGLQLLNVPFRDLLRDYELLQIVVTL